MPHTEASQSTLLSRYSPALLWASAVAWTVFTGWRLWGTELAWPFVIAMAYTPYVAAATIVPMTIALWARHWRTFAVLALCTATLSIAMAPRVIPESSAGADGVELNVLTANAMVGEADMSAIVSTVKDNDVDLLAVEELSKDAAAALADAGLSEVLPHEVAYPDALAAGAGIYSRHPLTEAEDLSLDGLFWMPAARIKVPDAGTVEFIAVHIAAPASPSRFPDWSEELAALPHANIGSDPTILAGDFNATADHAAFRDVLDSGYTDAAIANGDGMVATWQHSLLPLPVTLDHVLTDSEITAVETSTCDIPGSDHRALLAELVLPPE